MPRRVEVNALGEVYRSPTAATRPRCRSTAIPRSFRWRRRRPASERLLTKLSPDGSTAFYTVIFAGAQCQAMALGMEDQSGTRNIHLHVGTSFHYQRTLTEVPTAG